MEQEYVVKYKPSQAEAINELYGGAEVEIYVDGSVGQRMYSDYVHEEVIIIDGVVTGCHGDMLVMLASFLTSDGPKTKEILVNGWLIKAVMKKEDGKSLLSSALNLQRQKARKR